LPTGLASAISWAPNGNFVAIGHQTSPYISIYQRSGITFTKIADPSTLPVTSVDAIAWTPNSEILVVGHGSSPNLTLYQRSGTVFTKISDPATLPGGTVNCLSWSANGDFLAAGATSSLLSIYERSNTTLSLLPAPATLPAGATQFSKGVAFSSAQEFLSVAHLTSPFITIYQTSSTMPNSGIIIIKGVLRGD